MNGSVCIKNGVCYIGRHAKTAEVLAFDLDGNPLEAGFRFRGPEGASASGLDVDEDHRVWVADTAGRVLRAFTLVGTELARFPEPSDEDRAGALGAVVDVASLGVEHEQLVLAASSGRRRHALQLFRPDGTLVDSLRPLGDPQKHFHGLSGLAVRGAWTYVCEARAGRLQVFREHAFHYAIEPAPLRRAGPRPEPVAVAALSDGRLVVAIGGEECALLLIDAAGRLLRILAEHGEQTGQVIEPGDVALEETGLDRTSRVLLVDEVAERVQVFTLEGECYGAFAP